MNSLILCEGATDAILLSYYLKKVSGWTYTAKAPDGLNIRSTRGNESVNWYKRGNDYLLICGVGGKDNFTGFFHQSLENPIIHAGAFEKIAVITDRDKRETAEIEQSVVSAFGGLFPDVQDRRWVLNKSSDAFDMEKDREILLLIIPEAHEGALETVMLDAISEDEYDKSIVDLCRSFVANMRSEASRYISSDRLQLKAELGVTWAIQYPEKVFSLIDEVIQEVPWETYETLRECFKPLEEI